MKYLSLLNILKKYLTISWKRSKLYIPSKLFYAMLQSSVIIVRLYFVKWFLDSITEKQDIKTAIILLISFLVFHLFREILSSVLSLYIKLIQSDIQNDLQRDIIIKAFSLDLSNYDDAEFHDKRTRAIEYANNSASRIIDSIFYVISDLITLASSIYIISSLNIVVLVVLLFFTLLDLLVNKKRDEMMYKLKKETTRLNRKKGYSIGLVCCKSAMKDLILNGSIKFILHRFKEIYIISRDKMIDVDKKVEILRSPVRLIDIVFSCLVYFFVGYDLFLNVITVGDFSMIYGAAESLKNAITLIGANISNIRSMNLDAKLYEEFMNLQSVKNGSINLNYSDKFEIVFDNVWFKYKGQKDWAVKGITFKINQGEHILLVGENGVGKTTLINLMLRFYEPQIGDIYINGFNIKNYNREDLYKLISTVFQDFYIYAYSLRDNISLSLRSDENLMQQSLNSADLKKVVEKLPKGVDSHLTHDLEDDGVELSGGERQKVVLARSYYKNSKFLILDEPSSALDPISEEHLLKQYKKLTKDKTSIMVSHHLNNFYNADRILVMNNGTICESGTHEQLIKTAGKYHEMYMLQKTKFLSECD